MLPSWVSRPLDDNFLGVKLIAGNVIAWSNAVCQTLVGASLAHEFRTWTSWVAGMVVSGLTIHKLLSDRRRSKTESER